MSQTKAQLVSPVGILTASGVNVSGIVTASSFVGNLTGIASTAGIATYATTAGISTVSQGLTGTPNINVGVLTAVSGTFSGNVSIAGTLTYEDVTNIDSIGLVTARSGITITNGGLNVVGVSTLGVTTTTSLTSQLLNVSGVSTFSGGLNLVNLLRERVNITAGKLSDNTNINLENGMVHHFTTTETTTSTPNIRYNASTTLNSVMNVGEAIAVTIITTAAAAGYFTQLTIDGSAVTEKWLSGVLPPSGGASGNDIYCCQIIKTANSTYTVLVLFNNYT